MTTANKTILALLVLGCLCSVSSLAADVQIRVPCEELTKIEIWQFPDDGIQMSPGATGCTRGCYFPAFFIGEATEKRLVQEMNAARMEQTDFIVGDTVLFSNPPMLHDVVIERIGNKISPADAFMTEKEARDFAFSVCPSMAAAPGITMFGPPGAE